MAGKTSTTSGTATINKMIQLSGELCKLSHGQPVQLDRSAVQVASQKHGHLSNDSAGQVCVCEERIQSRC